MFYVIYRWKVKEGKEDIFEKAWAEGTPLIREHYGGLGSRLHRCSDGTYLGYAQWPDQKTWERFFKDPPVDTPSSRQMEDVVLSRDQPIQLNLVNDLLVRL